MKYLFVLWSVCLATVYAQTPPPAVQDSLPASSEIQITPPEQGWKQVRDTLPPSPEDEKKPGLDDATRNAKDSLARAQKQDQNKKKRNYRTLEIDTVAFIKNYKLYYEDGRTAYVDTTLSVQKEYRFNFLRKDYFELLPLNNVGQGFNKMGYDFLNQPLRPSIGARGKHYAYFEAEDIAYYEVPTPLTELFFKTTYEQGQLVDALVTVNTSPNFNFSVAYRGLRSLGKYVSSRSNAGQFRGTIHYNSGNERYRLRAHFTSQTIENQVNGGLPPDDVYFFEEAPYYAEVNPDGTPVVDENGEIVKIFYDGFLDRSRLGTYIRGSNVLSGKRTYISQRYQLLPSAKDSLRAPLYINNTFTYETKYFNFTTPRPNTYYGTPLIEEKLSDRSQVQRFENRTSLSYHHPKLGRLEGGVHFYQCSYFFENDAYDNAPSDTPVEATQLALVGSWDTQVAGWQLQAQTHFALMDAYATDDLRVDLTKTFFQRLQLKTSIDLRSQAPNFNMQRYKSDFENYNWDNSLQNQNSTALGLTLSDTKWGTLEGQWSRIKNYTYFRNTISLKDWGAELNALPYQATLPIDYLKLRFSQALHWGKFSLVNTVQYQQVKRSSPTSDSVLQEPLTLNVPEWITRNTLAFSTPLFNDALYLQTGLTFQFFTDFYADIYHPLLGEYVTQNNTLIGEFPRADFFINARIQQTRLFLKWEHFNSSYTGYDYYAAPANPYRDASIRFGLVWNFFQ
jgi:hypothetical protein